MKQGHDFAFLCMSDSRNPEFQSNFEVLAFPEATKRAWDVTMVPGAGFPSKTIRKFDRLVDAQFGLRVQHILNDQSLRDKFLNVNRRFKPDMVIFNNRHWPPGSFTEFQAKKFAFLEGAVDLTRFAPGPERRFPENGDRKIIAGLAGKNSSPLINAIRLLPREFELHLFGRVPGGLEQQYSDLIAAGRLRLRGLVQDKDLPEFYSGIDCVVHTAQFAGWANLGAEALACGIPLICTKNGTLAFARHLETALVLSEPTLEEIGEALKMLFGDKALARRLVENGKRIINCFSWKNYADELLELCKSDANSYYTFAPELGLYGKWPLSERFEGLEIVFENCKERTVLDLGAAEGIVSLECLKRGASRTHAFELDRSRVEIGRRLCADFPNSQFRQANLSDWKEFSDRHSDLLLDTYDIVLYLGIQHHLPKPARLTVLTEAASLAGMFFAIRTTDEVYNKDRIDLVLKNQGFVQAYMNSENQGSSGRCRIFKRSGEPGGART